MLTGTHGEKEGLVEHEKACTPLGYLGRVKDVAGAVLFLFQSPPATLPAR